MRAGILFLHWETCAQCAACGLYSNKSDTLRGRRYVGYALTTVWEGSEAGHQQVIGFDMGGTSTDVSRYAGTYEHVFESTTAGAPYTDAPYNPAHAQGASMASSGENPDECRL